MAAAEPARGSAGAGARLLIVGAGLIGTSLGLAARRAGYEVWLDDQDSDRVELAQSLGAGQAWSGQAGAALIVVATPPAAVARAVTELIRAGVAPVVTHVASVQARPQREVETLVGPHGGFVGSHPIAGRERSGPHHASADLFDKRPWVVCPAPASSPEAVAAVAALASSCGGVVTTMPANEHDRLFAQLSHAPQLVASALAAPLGELDRAQVALAGGGLRDTTRIADSDPRLWAEVIASNPDAVAAALRRVIGPLQAVLEGLEGPDPGAAATVVGELIARGRDGRGRLAGKHGDRAVRWDTVAVVVPDAPGRLARLLADAATAGVNVEDIRVDHAPGQPVGIVELDVAPDHVDLLTRELVAAGWSVTGLVS